MDHLRILAVVVCLAASTSCSRSTETPERAADVVARFGSLTITAADVDTRVLSLPPSERPAPGEDLDAWYREQIREIAVESRLRSDAGRERGDDDRELRSAQREAERQIGLQLCLLATSPDLGSVSDDELREAFEADSAAFSAPERRSAYHLFLRASTERPVEACRQEAERLRERVLRGEGFQKLAVEHSDSESRHQEGFLGWMTPGQLPEGFERVIFSLDEGVPSDPVTTRDGVHVFFVDQVLPPRDLGFEDVREQLRTRLIAQRQQQALEALESAVTVPPEAVVLDREQLRAAVESGDDGAIVLALDGTQLTLGELISGARRALARQPVDERPALTVELLWQRLDGLRRRELAYGRCASEGLVPEDELSRRVDQWREGAVLELERQRRLAALASENEDRLRLFFDSNAGQFSSPPRWRLRRLRVPLAESARADMARLEQAAAGIGKSLEQLRAELGGEIEDLGWRTLPELRGTAPVLPQLVAPVTPGSLTAPYRTRDSLEILEVLEKQDAELPAFDEVRERVVGAYVQHYTRELYDELSERILAEEELEILPEGLAALRTAGLPRREVSVEELESLLSEL